MAAPSKAVSAQSDGTQLTYNETVEVLCGFIKTAIHTILCHRQVYPANVFTRRQRYRVPVWASRHPGLTSYIEEVMDAAKVQIEKSALRSVHVVLTSVSSGQILERYRFDISILLDNIHPRDRNLSIPGNMTMETIELHMRSFMMKLISLDGALGDIENVEDVTWAVVLDMKDGFEPQTEDKSGNEPSQGPWVPFNKDPLGKTRRKSGERSQDSSGDGDGPFILPVKSLDTGVINLMLYVEEHPAAKRASQEEGSSLKGKSKSSQRRSQRTDHNQIDESIRVGERDIDEPLPQPTSSGAIASRGGSTKKKKKKEKDSEVQKRGDDDHSDASSSSLGSNDSGDSIQSVNDFAGYGKGVGSVGMSGVGW